jgi:quercetin dioxygenase-like cupin family protein
MSSLHIADGGATPDSAGAVASAVRVEVADPAGAPGRTLRIYHVQLEPGAVIEPHHHPGTQASLVTSGTLTYWVMTGAVVVYHGRADQPGGARAVRRIEAGQRDTIVAGEWFVEQPGVYHRAANESDEPVELEITALFENDQPMSIPVHN